MFSGGTPFDLQMHLFRIPVRVIPTFWLVAALLGWNPERLDLVFLWVMCVFGSVLFHELGHALTAEAFGYRPEIVLQHFGGYAAYLPGRDYSPWKSLLITIAGPIPQLMLGLLVLFSSPWVLDWLNPHLNDRSLEYVYYTIHYLVFINVGWALMNLLPVLPLDGGRIVQALLDGAGLRDAEGVALKISVGVGALVTAAAFQFHQQGMAILFLMITVQCLQTLQARRW